MIRQVLLSKRKIKELRKQLDKELKILKMTRK